MPTEPSVAPAPAPAPAPVIAIDRDLSWLQFNARVLAEAKDLQNPWLERAKFLGISASNLDEFFMIRFASLNRRVSTDLKSGRPEAARQIRHVLKQVVSDAKALALAQHRIFLQLIQALEQFDILIHTRPIQSPAARRLSLQIYEEKIAPMLPPPEPSTPASLPKQVAALGNLQLALLFGGHWGGHWLPIPKGLDLLYVAAERGTSRTHVFFLDDLIAEHAGVSETSPTGSAGPTGPAVVRLTRDSDLTIEFAEEDSLAMAEAVRRGIDTRERRKPVRIQYYGRLPGKAAPRLGAALRLDEHQVFHHSHTLLLHALASLVSKLPKAVHAAVTADPRLCFPPFKPRVPIPLRDPSETFAILRERDILLHHPYDPFEAFVAWIQTACKDPTVTQVELTVYRTDAISPIINALIEAARHKKVRVLIELRARFDELNNVALAERLRQAGVEVGFGFGKLKLHAKIALITRLEPDGPRMYAHLSTGNYNAATARQYTDLAILTAHPQIAADARKFFDHVVRGEVPTGFGQLVSAPTRLHRKILGLIDAEIQAAQRGERARIFAKVNALVDDEIIQALYKASSAGVRVELNVRGPCALIPGVRGRSENIRVISIVDRFLEHSRIYYFESARAMYLSSADWMPRNFFSRLEIAFPVLDPRLYEFIRDVVIPTYFADTAKARELNARGVWRHRRPPAGKPARSAQKIFIELSERDYRDTPLAYGAPRAPSPSPSRK